MDPAVTSLRLNLTATGTAAGTGVAAGGVHDIFRCNKYDDDTRPDRAQSTVAQPNPRGTRVYPKLDHRHRNTR